MSPFPFTKCMHEFQIFLRRRDGLKMRKSFFSGWLLLNGRTRTLAWRSLRSWRTSWLSTTASGTTGEASCSREATSLPSKYRQLEVKAGLRPFRLAQTSGFVLLALSPSDPCKSDQCLLRSHFLATSTALFAWLLHLFVCRVSLKGVLRELL